MKKIIFRLAILTIAGLTLVLSGGVTLTAQAAPPTAPRNLVALVGAGQQTTDVNAFFPGNIRIHVGDTVTWKENGDEIHTVTFVKGCGKK